MMLACSCSVLSDAYDERDALSEGNHTGSHPLVRRVRLSYRNLEEMMEEHANCLVNVFDRLVTVSAEMPKPWAISLQD